MILLDLELVLVEFNNFIKESGLYLPGSILTTNNTIFKQPIDTSKSIFRILILGESLSDFITTYTQIDPKEYFTYYLYDDSYYIPDTNGSNILNLTQNDLDYITQVNSNNTNITIEPDSDFLKAHKDLSYTPTTLLGKLIKLCMLYRKNIEISKNFIEVK